MPTGVTSAWGYPINTVNSGLKTMENGNHNLTYENSLTSYAPVFVKGKFQSPLTPIGAGNLVAFGRSYKRMSKKMCKVFLKNKSVNPVSGRKIKRSGKTFKRLMKDCEHHGLLKKKNFKKKN